ncbi:COMM domain-containing protein 3 [Venturia canescens]|uniref:COMM domain-containing protein 3 n=1 Tax=Venturia canescens TaxID=32260 RepID=UPI001C9D0C03|nr:COMM domain-containing protein 3-like [Venturia canescens]
MRQRSENHEGEMELSKTTIRGLENVQDPNLISDEIFLQLLEIVCTNLLRKIDGKNIENIYGSKPDVIKSAYADLSSLFVEAARHKLDSENFSTFLHTAKIFGHRAEKLSEYYEKYRDFIVAQLSQIGDGLPCIVDVDWRLDYCVKSSTNNLMGECLYNVRLVTKKHGKLDDVQFACTIQELQDLVYKLKEAVRHVEKIGSA